MPHHPIHLWRLLCTALGLVILGGCATRQPPAETSHIALATFNSRRVTITGVWWEKDDQGYALTGEATRHLHYYTDTTHTHLAIVLFDARGSAAPENGG